MATPRSSTYSAASGDSVWAGVARPPGFAVGGSTGTYNSGTKLWTPAKAGDGRVYAESWAITPTGEWFNVASTNLDGLTASITAPGWNSGNLGWQGVMNAWNGFAIDEAGSRVWLVAAGGHADSSNNGLYRFDCFKMAWAIERQPSDRTAWSSQYVNLTFPQPGTYTLNQESNAATPQAVAGEVVDSGKWYWDMLFWDRRPTSRHVYSGVAYRADTDELVTGVRSIWRFSRATGDWTYHRVWDTSLDGADLQGYYDQATGDYLQGGMGDGIRASRGYNLNTNTFAAWACPWIGDPWEGVADCRYGNQVTVWSPPFSDRTKTNYMVYDLASRSAVVARTTPQYGGGLSASSFRATNSGADGMGMVYVPPLNEYWILYNLAAGMTWLKLDPATTPWTLSPKTFSGTLPTMRDKPLRKIVWMPGLNAVLACGHESAGFYVYKF